MGELNRTVMYAGGQQSVINADSATCNRGIVTMLFDNTKLLNSGVGCYQLTIITNNNNDQYAYYTYNLTVTLSLDSSGNIDGVFSYTKPESLNIYCPIQVYNNEQLTNRVLSTDLWCKNAYVTAGNPQATFVAQMSLSYAGTVLLAQLRKISI